MKDKMPLVSVFVVTYNSGQYVVETLDSIKFQTYQNIELVISDDCSKDNTLNIVYEWLKENNSRFVRTKVVTTDINKGIPANYNRAVQACTGEWLKMVDGDDLLLPNCISDNVKYINANNDAKVVFSDFRKFRSYPNDIDQQSVFTKIHYDFFELSAEEQLKVILKTNILPSQTCFIYAELLKNNPYEERYFYLEDAPMWINLLNQGVHFYLLDKVTALYRICDSTMRNSAHFFTRPYYETLCQFFWDVKIQLIRKYNLQEAYNIHRKKLFVYELADIFLKNKKNVFTEIGFIIIKLFVKCCVTFKL